MQILVADESKGVRSLTCGILRQTRFAADTVREAEAGDQFTSWVHMRPAGPAIVVADWDLPGMNGSALMDCLEDLSLVEEIGVLFCVNRGQVPLAEEAVRRGARGFVVRPFSEDELRVKLDSAVPVQATPSDVLREIVTNVRAQEGLPTLLSLPSAVISELFAAATRVHTLAGETLIWPGQQVESLSFITAGEVDVLGAGSTAPDVRGTGDCFAERAFICGEPARVTVVARTAVDIVQVSKVRLVELARRRGSVRTFLGALLERPEQAAVPEIELNGSLESLPFEDLVQFLHSGRKTGLLLVERGDVQGVLYLSQGEAHDAQAAGKFGEDAFFEMSGWTGGRFEFRCCESAGERTLERPTMRLLMDAFARKSLPEPMAG